nr:MAG TPA: hypothetical protein [Bacteriophage sp.]DAS83230.1 MAG TPA: hypothetical protein [Caudoviricetes sp.]DAZ80817.1 MAG TPA: hypothetical protein [Caudoviricetes sp.]
MLRHKLHHETSYGLRITICIEKRDKNRLSRVPNSRH